MGSEISQGPAWSTTWGRAQGAVVRNAGPPAPVILSSARILGGIPQVFDAVVWGAMAVAVWPHKPSCAELLHKRLAEGWQPTASRLKEGAKVLGYAACLVRPVNLQ